MSVAKSDEGSPKTTRTPKRLPRKPGEPMHNPHPHPQPYPSGVPASVAPPPAGPTGSPRPSGARLDDLYRLPMPKLFALAEREGVAEHTGMSRAQLIVAIVRRQIERGEVVRGSGTLEVLPDGYGFLRSQAHNYLA